MSERKDDVYKILWTEDLEEIDREIARISLICGVRILELGVIRRVLQNDATVCTTNNPAAFKKLRDLLMLHLAVREKSADSFGQALTAQIEDHIIERLRKSFPDLAGEWPPK